MAGVFFAVIQTATIAAVGVAFSKFLAYMVPQVSEDLVAFTIGGLKISPAQLGVNWIDRLSHFHKYVE
jgi:APA family basic amino acid/polyamine antiporter